MMQKKESTTLIYEPNTISVYIHWPYCVKKCPYCDFNSFVSISKVNHDNWGDAYIKDLHYQTKFIQNRKIKSIFFGGGTPSLMEPYIVGKIIAEITKINNGEKPKEITLEVNPSSFENEKLKQFKQEGVNRISIGVQSFNEQQLKFLGRVHSKEEALNAINAANKLFDYVSFDLINGLPNQSLQDWEKELNKALPLIKSHISIYELTIEPGTVFYKQKKEAVNEILGRDLFLTTQDILAKQGIYNYEISNYSLPNHQSLHNLNYWRGGMYLGVGPGAHGRVVENNNIMATVSHKIPQKWLKSVFEDSCGFSEISAVDFDDRLFEVLLSNLRLNEAISPLILNHIQKEALDFLIEQKLLYKNGLNYHTTIEGKLKLNGVINYLAENFVN